MNKQEIKKVVNAALNVRTTFPLDHIENLRATYSDMEEALQEKIDRLESMEELGDTLQERLDDYNSKMDMLCSAKEALEEMQESYEKFTGALEEIVGTIE